MAYDGPGARSKAADRRPPRRPPRAPKPPCSNRAGRVRRGLAESPVRVLTPTGPLQLRWDEMIYPMGPAEIVARGDFYL